MDVGLPRMSGVDATRELKRLAPGILVVVLTVFEQSGTILQAICAGADGYLLKRSPAARAAGAAPPRGGRRRGADVRGGAPGARHAAPLGARRAEPLRRRPGAARPDGPRAGGPARASSDGLAYKQVALRLGIGLDTVRTHVRGVYRKLQVHSVASAVSRAIQEGLV